MSRVERYWVPVRLLLSLALAGTLVPTLLSAQTNASVGIRPVARPGEVRVHIWEDVEGYWPMETTSVFNDFTAPSKGVEPTGIPIATTKKDESLSRTRQSVAAMPNGSFMVVWERGSWPKTDVRMQIISSSGKRILQRRGLPITTSRTMPQFQPVVVSDPTGGAFVAFISGEVVRVQRFDANGWPQWRGRGRTLTVPVNREQYRGPNLVADNRGGVYACVSVVGFQRGIRCQHLGPGGGKRWGPRGILAGGHEGSRVLPKGLLAEDGGLLVFWQNIGTSYRRRAIEGQRFSSGTRMWGKNGVVVHKTRIKGGVGYGGDLLSAVSDGYGGAVIAFEDWPSRKRRSRDIGVVRIAPDGSAVWERPVRIRTTGPYTDLEMAMTGPEGDAFILFNQGHQSKIFLARITSVGTLAWPDGSRRISHADDSPLRALDYFAFGAVDGKKISIGWNRWWERTYLSDIFFVQTDLHGNHIGSAKPVRISEPTGGEFLHGLAVSPRDRTCLFVWDDTRKGFRDEDIYGAVQ